MSDQRCETCCVCGGDDADCVRCNDCGSPMCKACRDVGSVCCEDDDNRDIEFDDEDLIDGVGFADPGGRSALRAETPDNPRNLPCPTCGEPNRLTPIDVARGYQCDECADRAEGHGD